MAKENVVETIILDNSITSYLDNEYYCTCYLNMSFIQTWT